MVRNQDDPSDSTPFTCSWYVPAREALLDWNFSADWVDILVNSVTNDWPQKALK